MLTKYSRVTPRRKLVTISTDNSSTDPFLYLTRHGSYEVTVSLLMQAIFTRYSMAQTSNDINRQPFNRSISLFNPSRIL